jgi:concentrative nucleoside transporter, CNT family
MVTGSPAQRLQCLLGLTVFLAIAFVVGYVRYRRLPSLRLVLWGVGLQFLFAFLVLHVPHVLAKTNDAITALLGFTRDGATLVFGNLARPEGVPVTVTDGPRSIKGLADTGAYFAFFVLPTIIFFSTLTAIAYHSGVMQVVVHGLAWVMSKTMRTSGAETLSASANIFVGQTEAPLLIRPFLAAATQSELMCIMTAGFANIASGVLGVYTGWLQAFVPNVGGHLAAACFISAPGSLLVAKLMVPETETPATTSGVQFKVERLDANIIDAATRGTTEGVALAINVGAMLIAFTALVALVNGAIAWFAAKTGMAPAGGAPLTLQRMLGTLMAPLAWLAGVPWAESREAGSLLGIKTVLNELFAYKEMQLRLTANPAALSERSRLIMTYALCGFANIASIGIQVGGISTLAPGRRADLSRIAGLAMLGGALTSLMAAAVVGILV